MHNMRKIRKVLSFLTCTALSVGILGFMPASDRAVETSALTLPEIQARRQENEEKIAELEAMINELEGDKAYEQQQKDYLQQQVDMIQENITLLNAELKSIGDDIAATEQNIAALDADIASQQASIDENIELFKKRLCAMYINSGDSSASLVLGSSSFYDVMSRVQMINRVAEYDDRLINQIVSDIENLEASKSELESQKLQLNMKLDEQNRRKEEKAAELEILNEKASQTQHAIDALAAQQAKYQRDKEELQADIDLMNAEEDKIYAEIQRQQEEAQRRYEEEQRKKAEAANPTVQGPVYIPPTVAASGFAWPVPAISVISSYYGWRWNGSEFHKGLDIDGFSGGAAVIASQSGTVVAVNNSCTHNWGKNYGCGCGGNYGNYVTIAHDGTYSTLYGHMASAVVSYGQYVNQGDVIGYIGSTGWSTGPHLHFEVRVNGSTVNPLNYVSP